MTDEANPLPADGRLPVERLGWRCEAGLLGFADTGELPEFDTVIGQERAVEAIDFGLGMDRPGYNIFALGPEGTGRHSVVRRHVDRAAAGRPAPSDWCYVADFRNERSPHLLDLPAGRGAHLQADMARFTDDLTDSLRSAFESDEYRTRRQVIEEEFKERQEKVASEVEEMARQRGIALVRTPMGFGFAPLSEGKIVSAETFQQFPDAERERIQKDIQTLEKELQERLQQTPAWIRDTREKLRALNDEMATGVVDGLIGGIAERYADLPKVASFLDRVRDDVIESVEAIVASQQQPEQQGPRPPFGGEFQGGASILRRYRVNLVVDHAGAENAPVVYEDDPTYDRMFGRIEHRAEMGALLTDFHLIRSGSLHRANGGYLILDARKALTKPLVWEELKRSLISRELRIEPMLQAMGVMSTVSLEPETMPLDVKIVLVGDRMVYYLLCSLDPEFCRLFKVPADFDERVVLSDETVGLYARLIGTLARRENLRPLDAGAAAHSIEHLARLAGDSERLSTEIEALADLLREADHWTGRDGAAAIGDAHVRRALAAQERRLDRIRERMLDEIDRGTVAISTSGEVVGQINGLAVLQIGGYAFGRPSRITARVRMGRGEVIDIEREVALGGPLHSKGVLILTGYIANHFATEHPLSLSAALVFEQSYGGVDGDSASSTELYALISAISGVPIRQGYAVTGSVDQYGRVQAIGGVNEKIEGFFDVCAARGLDGNQGVLIPATNVKHLMLADRVRDAVAEGRFAVHAVETIEQGIEILTGRPAGRRGADGRFPDGTVFRLVEDRLIALAERRRAFGWPLGEDGRSDDSAGGQP